MSLIIIIIIIIIILGSFPACGYVLVGLK